MTKKTLYCFIIVLLAVPHGVFASASLEERAKEAFWKDYNNEQELKSRVKIISVEHSLSEPLTEDLFPQYGQEYDKASFIITLDVKKEGTYQVNFRFRSSNSGQDGRKKIVQKLNPGKHTVTLELLPEDMQTPIVWLDGGRGKAEIQVKQLTTEKEIFEDDWRTEEERFWHITNQTLPIALSTVSTRRVRK